VSTYPAPPAPHDDRPRLVDWLVGSFWVADAMILGMLAFFMVLGSVNPSETAGFAIVFAALALLLAFHLWQLHRHHREMERSPASRYARERRGF
jgi:quinol-cytochrome oxidoreductase complex cytochrome b subunit